MNTLLWKLAGTEAEDFRFEKIPWGVVRCSRGMGSGEYAGKCAEGIGCVGVTGNLMKMMPPSRQVAKLPSRCSILHLPLIESFVIIGSRSVGGVYLQMGAW